MERERMDIIRAWLHRSQLQGEILQYLRLGMWQPGRDLCLTERKAATLGISHSQNLQALDVAWLCRPKEIAWLKTSLNLWSRHQWYPWWPKQTAGQRAWGCVSVALGLVVDFLPMRRCKTWSEAWVRNRFTSVSARLWCLRSWTSAKGGQHRKLAMESKLPRLQAAQPHTPPSSPRKVINSWNLLI